MRKRSGSKYLTLMTLERQDKSLFMFIISLTFRSFSPVHLNYHLLPSTYRFATKITGRLDAFLLPWYMSCGVPCWNSMWDLQKDQSMREELATFERVPCVSFYGWRKLSLSQRAVYCSSPVRMAPLHTLVSDELPAEYYSRCYTLSCSARTWSSAKGKTARWQYSFSGLR